ncbi:Hypothetical predicted protein [Marmota monax]|uniref:Prolactin n=1 Tax=Marmota monax TaxID=9995 RepID=A0A5E4A572_MARMO|nr:hypothetical protein GHT09_007838 [Marmota monax]VTJ51842.1 Hypothetical predicted protein [Marmota monax]
MLLGWLLLHRCRWRAHRCVSCDKVNGAVNCQVSLRDLFDRAVILSHYIHNLSSEMFNEFDKRYAQGRGFITKAINSCHTSSLSTPEDKEQAQQIHVSPQLALCLSHGGRTHMAVPQGLRGTVRG